MQDRAGNDMRRYIQEGYPRKAAEKASIIAYYDIHKLLSRKRTNPEQFGCSSCCPARLEAVRMQFRKQSRKQFKKQSQKQYWKQLGSSLGSSLVFQEVVLKAALEPVSAADLAVDSRAVYSTLILIRSSSCNLS